MRGLMGVAGVALVGLVTVAPQARLYGAENIERYVRKHGRSRQVGNSPAGYPHEHKREIARRQRQAERVRENRIARAERANGGRLASVGGEPVGLSRRGRYVSI